MRKIFIGSSTEGFQVAERLKDILNEELNDFCASSLWKDGKIFSMNKSALDSLMTAARKFDYGILVATKDDFATVRNVEAVIPRDNVMFEMGMFLGSLGLTRAFLLVERHAKLPSDYNGVTVAYFEKDIQRSLENAIVEIVDVIRKSKQSFNLKPVPSAALALSYFDNFLRPLAKNRLATGVEFKMTVLLPKNIDDIETTINFYKRKNSSEEISISKEQKRPFFYKYQAEDQRYWDIPTTLQTLGKLISYASPAKEIGVDQDRQDWVEQELRDFKGTIEILVKTCTACNGSIQVEYLT